MKLRTAFPGKPPAGLNSVRADLSERRTPAGMIESAMRNKDYAVLPFDV